MGEPQVLVDERDPGAVPFGGGNADGFCDVNFHTKKTHDTRFENINTININIDYLKSYEKELAQISPIIVVSNLHQRTSQFSSKCDDEKNNDAETKYENRRVTKY